MKTLDKEAAVSKLVTRYARRLKAMGARALRAEWSAVLGDDPFPQTAAEAVAVLAQDFGEWMGALEALELEVVWEDQVGSPVRIAGPAGARRAKRKAA